MRLSDVATMVQGQLVGEDVSMRPVAIDSREIQPGDVFVALKGKTTDGHQYINEAIQRGARAVVTEQVFKLSVPQLIVENSAEALVGIGHYYRQTINAPVIAITGSCGKTTTRGMLASILSQNCSVLASQRSFNTRLGLPVVLSKWAHQDYAVFEAGANAHGELDELSHLLKPDIAIITTIGEAHLEGFGSLKGVAQAKSELFNARSPEGVAIVNADAPYAAICCEQARQGGQYLTFGIDHQADIQAHDIVLTDDQRTQCYVETPTTRFPINLPLLGRHQVNNALAAIASAFWLGIDIDSIQAGLNQAHTEAHRLKEIDGLKGARIIDDCYNANPQSSKSAIELLANYPGQRVLVMADMGELGDDAAQRYHEALGRSAWQQGIDCVYTFGELAQHIASAFDGPSAHFQSIDELIKAVKAGVDDKTTVLVKGSRSMRLERIVQALT